MGKAATGAVDDHLGLWLARAARDWRGQMRHEMAARGFPWHGEARGELLTHLGPEGLTQSELTARMGFSKQAVQQLLDQLESDGVVSRAADPLDRRARHIRLTELGLRDLAERGRVQRALETRARVKLGDKRYRRLEKALRRLLRDGQ